jgi:hypothetical protein
VAPPEANSLRARQPSDDEASCAHYQARRQQLQAEGAKLWACIEAQPPVLTQAERDALAETESSSGTSAATQPEPDWCTDRWLVTRTRMCKEIERLVTIYNVQTGAATGTITYRLVNYSYTDPLQLAWAHQTTVIFMAATGNGFGAYVQGAAGCAAARTSQPTSCRAEAPASFPASNMNPRYPVSGEAFFNSGVATSGGIGYARTFWNYTITSPNWTNSLVFSESSPDVRCDAVLPGGTSAGRGCIVPAFTPVIEYSRTGPYPELARHIGDAQASGLPGAYPSGQPLNRLYKGDDSKDNRTLACPDQYTRPTGKSCDEYPFASSQQGASTGGGTGRTFSYCLIPQLPQGVTGSIGYSSCIIDGAQNSGGGSALGAMYRVNRVLENDPFRVWIKT